MSNPLKGCGLHPKYQVMDEVSLPKRKQQKIRLNSPMRDVEKTLNLSSYEERTQKNNSYHNSMSY